MERESLWVKWIKSYRLKGRNFWSIKVAWDTSWSWQKILSIRELIQPYIKTYIGDGKEVSLWFDWWHSIGSLDRHIPPSYFHSSRLGISACLTDVFQNNQWVWPQCLRDVYPNIFHTNLPKPIVGTGKQVCWLNKEGKQVHFSTRQVWNDISTHLPRQPWCLLIWNSHFIPRHFFITWLAIHHKLMTQDKMRSWRNHEELTCSLCNRTMDSHEHLFLQCEYIMRVWRCVQVKGKFFPPPTYWPNIMTWCAVNLRGKNIATIIGKLLLCASVYAIW